MLDDHAGPPAGRARSPVSDATEVRDADRGGPRRHVSDAVKQYVVDLANATRDAPDLRLGASPRATLQLLRAAKAAGGAGRPRLRAARRRAALAGPCSPTGCCSTAEAQIARRGTDGVVESVLRSVAVPRPADGAAGARRRV